MRLRTGIGAFLSGCLLVFDRVWAYIRDLALLGNLHLIDLPLSFEIGLCSVPRIQEALVLFNLEPSGAVGRIIENRVTKTP